MDNTFPDSLHEPFMKKDEDKFTSPAAVMRGLAFLFVTIGLEVSGTLLIRKGVDDIRFYTIAFPLYFLGLSMFSVTLRDIPLSVAYTTWCALGTIGVSLGASLFFDEEIGVGRWMCILGTIPLIIGMYTLP